MSLSALHPYQRAGAARLARSRVLLLGDEPGLGKSAQVAAALEALDHPPALIVCPAIVRTHWAHELERWTPRRRLVRVVYQPAELAGHVHKAPPSTVIVSYEFATKHRVALRRWMASRRSPVLVLDEAHYARKPGSQRAVAVLGEDGLAPLADRIWALTGTPMAGHAGDLWTLLATFGATQLSYDAWIEHHTVGHLDGYQWRVTGTRSDRAAELAATLAPVMLRRRKDEVGLELPPITYQDILLDPVDLSDRERHDDERATRIMLEQAFQHFLALPDGRRKLDAQREAEEALIRAALSGHDPEKVLAQLTALAKSTSTLRRYVATVKAPMLSRILQRELAEERLTKVLIFTYSQVMTEYLRETLLRWGAETIYGGTPQKKREARINTFATSPMKKVLIASLGAMSTGADGLQGACREVVFAERDWQPHVNIQAIGRLHRQGQRFPVRARVAHVVNTIDEAVGRVLTRKEREITSVLDSDSARLAAVLS